MVNAISPPLILGFSDAVGDLCPVKTLRVRSGLVNDFGYLNVRIEVVH